MKLISLNKDSFESKKDWENICKTFHLSDETSEIYFYPKNIITSEDYKQTINDSITSDRNKNVKLYKSNFF